MPSIVLTDVTVVAGASTLTPQVRSLSLNYESAPVVETAMGQTTEVNKHSIYKWGGSVRCKTDYAAAGVDSMAFALIGTTASFVAKPTSAVAGPNNPAYTGTCLFTGYQPIKGDHGALAEFDLSFVSAGPLTRVVA